MQSFLRPPRRQALECKGLSFKGFCKELAKVNRMHLTWYVHILLYQIYIHIYSYSFNVFVIKAQLVLNDFLPQRTTRGAQSLPHGFRGALSTDVASSRVDLTASSGASAATKPNSNCAKGIQRASDGI